MASPRFTIDGIEDGAIKDSWSTNNRKIADKMAVAYQKRYGRSRIFMLSRIDDGVSVYLLLREVR